MFFLVSRGYRCIAHDRRGHGRSGQPWGGNDMGTYADDLAKLVEALDLKNASSSIATVQVVVASLPESTSRLQWIGKWEGRTMQEAIEIGYQTFVSDGVRSSAQFGKSLRTAGQSLSSTWRMPGTSLCRSQRSKPCIRRRSF
jgi:hypothetical protein